MVLIVQHRRGVGCSLDGGLGKCCAHTHFENTLQCDDEPEKILTRLENEEAEIMKVSPSVKRRCPKCKIIRRRVWVR
jgi:hypothetical protein